MLKHSRVIKIQDVFFSVDFLIHWVPKESDSLSELVYLLKSRLSFTVWKYYVEKLTQFQLPRKTSLLKTALIPVPGSCSEKKAYHTQYFARAWQEFSPGNVLNCLKSDAEHAKQKDLTLSERSLTKMKFLEEFTNEIYTYERIILIDDIVTSGHTLQASFIALKPHLRPDCLIEIKALLSRDKIWYITVMVESKFHFKKVIMLVALFATCLSFAGIVKTIKSDPNKALAIEILKKYNSATAVEMQTTKQVTKATLGTTSDAEGILLYSKNKIYFSSEKPTKTEIIYNKNVWVIEYPDLDFDDKAGRKITMFDSSKLPFIKTIAELLSSPEKFLASGTAISVKDDSVLIESEKIKSTSLKKFVVVLDKKDKLISSILLTDDLNTDTTFKIQKTNFLKTVSQKKFTYKKIKTDEILKPWKLIAI